MECACGCVDPAEMYEWASLCEFNLKRSTKRYGRAVEGSEWLHRCGLLFRSNWENAKFMISHISPESAGRCIWGSFIARTHSQNISQLSQIRYALEILAHRLCARNAKILKALAAFKDGSKWTRPNDNSYKAQILFVSASGVWSEVVVVGSGEMMMMMVMMVVFAALKPRHVTLDVCRCVELHPLESAF